MTEKNPQERASAAAEALAAEGAAVTARAVQQRAQVGMVVAASAAREWNEREAQAVEVPPMPDAVATRNQGSWRESVMAAREMHQVERDGWAARLKAAEEERDGAFEEIDRETARSAELEAERDQARDETSKVLAEVAQLRADVSQAHSDLAEAEARTAVAEAIVATFREALPSLSASKQN